MIHGAKKRVRVIVPSGVGVGCEENFIVDTWIGKICDAKESLGILVFNSYVVGGQIVRDPVAARLGSTYESCHPTKVDEDKKERGCKQQALTMTEFKVGPTFMVNVDLRSGVPNLKGAVAVPIPFQLNRDVPVR